MRIVVAWTGASGAIYAERFLVRAAELGAEIDLLVSRAGVRVAVEELGYDPDPARGPLAERLGEDRARVRRVPPSDIGAECASGSVEIEGMAIIPCSMGTLARIANGVAGTLIERAADVTLKERRPLVMVPRETPLNRIHVRNMLRMTEAGAVLVPAMPGFYHRPRSIDDLVDSVVDRALSFFFGNEVIRRRWSPRGDRTEDPR